MTKPSIQAKPTWLTWLNHNLTRYAYIKTVLASKIIRVNFDNILNSATLHLGPLGLGEGPFWTSIN